MIEWSGRPLISTLICTQGQDFWEYSCAALTSSWSSFSSKNSMFMGPKQKSHWLNYVTVAEIIASSQKENVSEVWVAVGMIIIACGYYVANLILIHTQMLFFRIFSINDCEFTCSWEWTIYPPMSICFLVVLETDLKIYRWSFLRIRSPSTHIEKIKQLTH